MALLIGRLPGMTLFKFYFSLRREEQARRLEEPRNNPLRQWQRETVKSGEAILVNRGLEQASEQILHTRLT